MVGAAACSAKGLPERTNFTFEDPDILESSGVDDDEQSGLSRGLNVCCVGLLDGGNDKG